VRLTVNGAVEEIVDGTTVGELVRGRTDQRRAAVARNGEVVPRSFWDDTVLADGDLIEVLAATAGG
jgi:sulfur carrier protein